MLRVFVVDDECLVIEGIRLLMEEVNIECEIVGSAYDGISAWNAIQEKHPDVLITDIKIPGIDGLDLISKCKKTFSSASGNCDQWLSGIYACAESN